MFYNAKNIPTGHWTEQTGAATSSDLRTWERASTTAVLPNGGPGSFDELFASDPCVLKVDDLWVMFYFGLDAKGTARDSYAVSRDLLHWEKSDEILIDAGPVGSLDDVHAHKPAILYRDGVLEHYYCAVKRIPAIEMAGYSQSEMRGIGLATSA